MISRARIIKKNEPVIIGACGDCRITCGEYRITCCARIVKFDVRTNKTCDRRIGSRAVAMEEYETARETIVIACNASIDCRVTSVCSCQRNPWGLNGNTWKIAGPAVLDGVKAIPANGRIERRRIGRSGAQMPPPVNVRL